MDPENFHLSQVTFFVQWVGLFPVGAMSLLQHITWFYSGDGVVLGLFNTGIDFETYEQHDRVEIQPQKHHEYGSK
jgi:hypothetical protein